MARDAARWLAKNAIYARTVTIKVRYDDFTTITRSQSDARADARRRRDRRARAARCSTRPKPAAGRSACSASACTTSSDIGRQAAAGVTRRRAAAAVRLDRTHGGSLLLDAHAAQLDPLHRRLAVHGDGLDLLHDLDRSTTLPNTVYLPSSACARAVTMKNDVLAVSGSARRAIDSGAHLVRLIVELRLQVAHVLLLRLASGSLRVGRWPVWITKPLTTRWKLVPS